MTSNPVVRIALTSDIDALYDLALAGGTGLTNLPPDRSALESKLAASQRAINSHEDRKSGAAILFIVEMDNKVVGTSCIFPCVGAQWPFYSYRITRQAAKSLATGRTKAQSLLNLVNDFDGEAEVGGLFIDPSKRGYELGTLAARSRYLFMASHRDWFKRKVIAELRGWQNEKGESPLWEAVGRHFYLMEFEEADRMGALHGNQFIADLGPRYPLYISLLTEDAQVALGQPHADGKPAYEMLLNEGFQAGDYVDIFDGGPTVVADIDNVVSIRDSNEIALSKIGGADISSIVATGTGENFRVGRGKVSSDGAIDSSLAEQLSVGIGDKVRYVTT